MDIILAFLSATFAALVTITAKLVLNRLDEGFVPVVTAVRAVIMAILLVTVAIFSTNVRQRITSLQPKDWLYILLAGLFGAISWLAYFWALKLTSNVRSVYAIDKLSIVLIVILTWLIFKKPVTLTAILGAILMFAGVFLIGL